MSGSSGTESHEAYNHTHLRQLILMRPCNKSGIEAAIQNNVKVDAAISEDGLTALHYSIDVLPEADCIHVVQIFLSHGANPNMHDRHGARPVHYAAAKDYCQVLNLLLVNGGDPLLGDIQGLSPIDYSFQHGCTDAFNILKDLLDNEDCSEKDESSVVMSFLKEEVVDVFSVPNEPNTSHDSICNVSSCSNDKDNSELEASVSNLMAEDKCHRNKEHVEDLGSSNGSFGYKLNSDSSRYGVECNIESDSDCDLLALQQCLENNLQFKCNSSDLSNLDSYFNSFLDYTCNEFDVAQSNINITSSEDYNSVLLFDDSYCQHPFKQHHVEYDVCDKGSQRNNGIRSSKSGFRNCEENCLKNNNFSRLHCSESTAKETHAYRDMLDDSVDVNCTAPLNVTKPDFCSSFQLLKAPKKLLHSAKFIKQSEENVNGCKMALQSSKGGNRATEALSFSYVKDIENPPDASTDEKDANETAPLNVTRPECYTSFQLLKAPKKKSICDKRGDSLSDESGCCGSGDDKVARCLSKNSCNTATNISTLRASSPENMYIFQSAANGNTGKSCGSKGSTCQFIVRVAKEYLYKDFEKGISLIERRCPANSVSSLSRSMGYTIQKVPTSEEASTGSGIDVPDSMRADCSFDSVGSLTESIKRMKGESLRKGLKEIGFFPGPILPNTERVYQRHLMRLRRNPNLIHHEDNKELIKYSRELKSAMEDISFSNRKFCISLEQTISSQFSKPDQSRHWRDGTSKSCFNYLLLDPRITQDLPMRGSGMDEKECFKSFISAIFYIGKGTRARPYYHLYEAFVDKKEDSKRSAKAKRIKEIWAEGVGVVSLHVFQNTIPVEAWTREAAMISALGLENLSNSIKGTFYGVASTWKYSDQRCFGTYLLRRAWNIFMYEGERQLRPSDVTLPTWIKKK